MPPLTHIQSFSQSLLPSRARFVRFQLHTRIKFVKVASIAAAVVTGNLKTENDQPPVVLDSLRVLQWDQLCDCVASFAGTSLGARATKEQLWDLDKTYDDSVRLLEETNAAVEMHKYGAMMDFTGIDVALVETAIRCARSRRGFPVSGSEAMALVALLRFAEALQLNVKAAIKEDFDWFKRFLPLSEMIMELVISQSLIKFIENLVEEDGSVKDSASSNLRNARGQVRILEKKLHQLMESMIRKDITETSALEVCYVDGRWCIKSGLDIRPTFEGLLLTSGSGEGSLLEPLSAVPLNDELQQARAAVAKAEADVLLQITNKMQMDLHDIEILFNVMVRIDVINAKARYSLSFQGAYPDLYLPQDKDINHNSETSEDNNSVTSQLSRRRWTVYLPKAHHPLLLQQHRNNLQKATKELSNVNAEIRRRKQLGGTAKWKEETNFDLSSVEVQVANLKQALPVPFDMFIAQDTKVVVITGPNTGGKTICLKTVGLAAMMAKSGLFVLASEPARIPWFDFVFADIGDEQSLSQSLSTFSGHLKQISEIKSFSTSRSLVLLDEVGAGTNPVEGAALGMSLLESFADGGALLTVATTHHGELKTLKYSNKAFENACMEFDEVNLKPTYRILWGVPGRSNAINIAERLGLPFEILDNARTLYGAASTEINEVIVDMERFKQEYHERLHEAQHYLRLSRDLHQSLIATGKRVTEHQMEQRYKMVLEITKVAASARSILHKDVRESRSVLTQRAQQVKPDKNAQASTSNHSVITSGQSKSSAITTIEHSVGNNKQSVTEKRIKFPKVGDTVNVRSINKQAKVLNFDPSKEEIVVQSGFMKLKLKLADIVI